MSRHPRADLYLTDRNNGMTLRQIAEKHGVSYQAVATSIANIDASYRMKITKKGCIYPNLRNWLNSSKPRQEAFFRALKGHSVRAFMNGTRQPKKDVIDTMLRITGMTYEEMFKEDL